MTTPDAVEKPVPLPHCPHCDAEMVGIASYNWPIGQFLALCLYCAVCLKTLHFSTIPIALVQPVEEPGRIQMPH